MSEKNIPKSTKINISVLDYNSEKAEICTIGSIEECFPYKDSKSISWINVEGTKNKELLQKLDEHFGIHPLVIDDVENLSQRPKMEDYGDYLFFIIKMIAIDEKTLDMVNEQVGIILGKNYLISFQEGKEGDIFEAVRERILNNKGKIRKTGTDYLLYKLIDAVIDNYFNVLEVIGEKIEDLEEELVNHPSTEILHRIQLLKKEMIYLRKSVWPLREAVSNLERVESSLVHSSTRFYFRNLYDHTIQVIDSVESLRDILSGMLDIYLSSISNRLNEVMKVLTIISTIFIPLTFVVGLYGMNFKYMPELSHPWGYPVVLGILVCISIAMLLFFRRKRWI